MFVNHLSVGDRGLVTSCVDASLDDRSLCHTVARVVGYTFWTNGDGALRNAWGDDLGTHNVCKDKREEKELHHGRRNVAIFEPATK